MFSKIFLIILTAATLAISILIYIQYGWLQSIGAPGNVALNYDYYSTISSTFLYISALILLLAANVVLWKTRKAWAMWISFLYFAFFTIVQTFWLEQMFFQYEKQNNLATNMISTAPFFGVILVILAAVVVFFNQYLVKRLHDKMYPPIQPIEPLPEADSANKDRV